jgi:hypothetical protein
MSLTFTTQQWTAAFAAVAGFDSTTPADYTTAAVGKVYRAERTRPATDYDPATQILAVDVVVANWLGTTAAQALAAPIITTVTTALRNLTGATVAPALKATRLSVSGGRDFWLVTMSVFEEAEVNVVDGGSA